MNSIAFFMFSTIIILFFLLILAMILFVLTVIPIYKISKRANLKNCWISCIPILNIFTLLNLANMSGFVFIGILILFNMPFIVINICPTLVNIEFCINYIIIIIYLTIGVATYTNYKICKNFNVGLAWFLLSLLSCAVITFWYIFLSKKQFTGQIRSKYIKNKNQCLNQNQLYSKNNPFIE